MNDCTHDCSTCESGCEKKDFIEKPHGLSRIGAVVGVVSGKGGVGKSTVASLLAVELKRRGFKVGILDADITGPSIPRAFGLTEKAGGGPEFLLPVRSKGGIDVMSLNLLTANETDPVVWRGPVIAGAVKQFWTDVVWDVDFLIVDMPPGTGDVPLTVFQSIPLGGVIVVTSPQDLVTMIVAKALKMAEMMRIPVLGMIENYAYLLCPDCGRKIPVFGPSRLSEVAGKAGVKELGSLPVDSALSGLVDRGEIENASTLAIAAAADAVAALKRP